jgi:hypothetical protein
VKDSRLLSLALLLWGVAVFAYLFGTVSAARNWFPFPAIQQSVGLAKKLARGALGRVDPPYVKTKERRTAVLHGAGQVAPGLTLISGVGPDRSLFIKLIDVQGRVHHAWDADWFRLWPNPRHVPQKQRPKSRPGSDVHGMLLSGNGDLTFNYDGLGLIQLDVCGRPKWRLPRLTGHSLFRDEHGDLWTFDYVIRTKPDPAQPNRGPRYFEYRILKVSPQGQVLQEIPVDDLFIRNGYRGLLYLNVNEQDNDSTATSGDTLHLNSIEVFPSTMKSSVFHPDDVMVSMRNINAIVVFDPRTLVIRKLIIGRFVRQHDAHFADGSTITLFDNNNLGEPPDRASSRVLAYSVADDSERVLFEGTKAHPFYSYIMGKQYTLANGDLLVTEAVAGRALEINPKGEVVWEYFNQAGPGKLASLSDAQRIAPSLMDDARLKALAASCPAVK